jgi:hypothetical protein
VALDNWQHQLVVGPRLNGCQHYRCRCGLLIVCDRSREGREIIIWCPVASQPVELNDAQMLRTTLAHRCGYRERCKRRRRGRPLRGSGVEILGTYGATTVKVGRTHVRPEFRKRAVKIWRYVKLALIQESQYRIARRRAAKAGLGPC